MIGLIAACGIAVALALTLVRLFAGPTLYDRALVATSIVLKTALLCAALAVVLGSAEAVEAALMLVLGAFALNAAVLKFFRMHTFQAPMARAEERS
jgi:multicomponent Na+:H+ antiporter subunit F